jgi:hypothetical protein
MYKFSWIVIYNKISIEKKYIMNVLSGYLNFKIIWIWIIIRIHICIWFQIKNYICIHIW